MARKPLSKTALRLEKDILREALKRGIDPYTQPFVPGKGKTRNQKQFAFGLDAGSYSAFADRAPESETLSGRWSPDVLLTVVKKERNVFWYLLLRQPK